MKSQKVIRIILACLVIAAFLAGCSSERPVRVNKESKPTKAQSEQSETEDGLDDTTEETTAATTSEATGLTADDILALAGEQSTHLLAMESLDAVSFQLKVTDWTVASVTGNVNLDADSAEEQILLGLDNPSGVKALVIQQESAFNLMEYFESYPDGYFSDYGDVELGTTLEMRFADIDNDGTLDCLFSVHTEELGTSVTVFKSFDTEPVLCPYVDIGTFQNLDAAWLDADGTLWMVSKSTGALSSAKFQPISMQYAAEEDGTTSAIYKKRVHVQDMDGNVLPIAYQLVRAQFAGAGDLQQLIAQNRWYLLEDEYVFLQFEEDTFLIGDTGTWTTYRFVDGAVDLADGTFSCHAIESFDEGDGDYGTGAAKEENIDFRFQFSKMENTLALSFLDHNVGSSASFALALDTFE